MFLFVFIFIKCIILEKKVNIRRRRKIIILKTQLLNKWKDEKRTFIETEGEAQGADSDIERLESYGSM